MSRDTTGARRGGRKAPAASELIADHWRNLPLPELAKAHRMAQACVDAFAGATARSGSLIQAWIQGSEVEQYRHYPEDDIVDLRRGSQYYYHCHRDHGGEHGHLHVFYHATRSGRRRRVAGLQRPWVRCAPSHLIAIGFDPRGLPISFFTVNRWVTDGYWFDAPTTLAMIDRFSLDASGGFGHANAWLTGFLRWYRPVIEQTLRMRDAALETSRNLDAALDDRRIELASQMPIDWAFDLEALDREVAARKR